MTRAANLFDLPREIRSHIYSVSPLRQEMMELLREHLGSANAVVRRGNIVFRVYTGLGGGWRAFRRRQGSAQWVALHTSDLMRRVVTKKRQRYEVVGLGDRDVVTARLFVIGGDKARMARTLEEAVRAVI